MAHPTIGIFSAQTNVVESIGGQAPQSSWLLSPVFLLYRPFPT